MKKVVSAGDCCIDLYEKMEGRYYPTGNCVDFAVNIRTYGYPTAVISVAGSDRYGDDMIGMLEKMGLDASRMKRAEGKTAVALMDMIGNDRLHTHFDEGVLSGFDLTGEDLEFMKGFDLIHGCMWGKINHHLPTLREYGVPIAYDFSTFLDDPEIDGVIPYLDYGFFSYKEDDDYIRDYLRDKHGKGFKVAISTLGEHGCIAYDGDKFYTEQPLPVTVVNTVGAGDSFISGFCHGVLSGMDVQGCLKSGAEIAARIIQVFEPYELRQDFSWAKANK